MNKIREAFEKKYPHFKGDAVCREDYLMTFKAGYQAAQSQLEGELQEALGALKECRRQFAFYAREHSTKGKSGKAKTNVAFVDRCDEILNNYTIEEEDCPECGGEGLIPRDEGQIIIRDKPCPDCTNGKIPKFRRKVK